MGPLGRFLLVLPVLCVAMVCSAAEPSPSLQRSPIAFEANRGQAPQKYSFLFHRDGLRAIFYANGADLALCGRDACNDNLALTFVGAHSVPESTSTLTGHANYLYGNDSSRWIRDIPLSSTIEYKNLYPGISLSFYGNGQELEHDFRVAPGADPSSIALRFDGAARIDLTDDGGLEIHTTTGALVLKKPFAYQETGDNRRLVDARFQQTGDGEIRFHVGAYDRSRLLVIDPVIVFASYLGGTGTDLVRAVTTDANGDVLVTGSTTSTDFPTRNALQSSLGSNGQSVFVTKVDPTGQTLIYSTYLGGSSQALGATSAAGDAIAVDANGNAIIAGLASSTNIPVAGAGSALSCQTNDQCFFVASLSPDGSTLNYSGTVGGQQGFYIFGSGVNLAVDAAGNAYLAGTTDDPNFQITPGTLATSTIGYPHDETFVLKVDPTGKLLYSTVVPGADTNSNDLLQPYTNDFIPTGIAVDTSGDVTIEGTAGLGLPTTSGVVAPQFPNAYVNVENPSAGFALQINPSASAINFATYLPGTDFGGGLTASSAGNLYITGGTGETNLPVSVNAYEKTIAPNSYGQYAAGYIMELSPQATSVLSATYLGGNTVGSYGFSGIALDSHDNVFVGGYAISQSFPLQNPFVTEYEVTGSIADLVLAGMSPDLSALAFGTYLSATSGVYAGSGFAGLAVDNTDHLIAAGTTAALDFPTTSGSFEPQLPTPSNANVGLQHSFVARFDMSAPAPAVCFSSFSVTFGNVNAGSSSSQTLIINNCGNATLDVSSIASSAPTVTASDNCSSVAPGSSCSATLTFAPVNSTATNGTITLSSNAQTTPQTVSFNGQGIAPEIVAGANPQSFGHVLVGAPAVNGIVLISNGGEAALTVGTVSVSGAGYSLVNNGCTQTIQANSYQSCAIEIAFAPASSGTQTGTVVIASNDPATPQLTVGLTGVGDAVYAVPSISSISAPTVLINSGAVTLSISGANFYAQSIAELNGVTLATTFQGNSTLAATIPASSLTTIGEQSLTVVNPLPGGGASAPVTVTPYQTLVVNPSALVSVPATGMLYAAIPASATNSPNTVIPIDPATGALGTPIPVGNNPLFMAASSDGSYLFVANAVDETVQRINLATGAVDRTFPYTPNIYCSTCSTLDATDLQAVPGSPREVLLAQGSILSLFNDSGLVNYVPSTGACCYADPDFGSIALAGNPLTVYGLPFSYLGGFFQMASLTSSGLQYTRPTGSSGGPDNSTGSQVISDGTLLYTSAGQVWDPATQTELGTFPLRTDNQLSYPNGWNISLDTTLGQIYGVGNQLTNSTDYMHIFAFGIKSYALTGSLAFPQIYAPGATHLVRWGKDGLAFIGPGTGGDDQEVYILRSGIVSPQSAKPTPTLASISPASASAGDPAFTLTVNGASFLSGSVIEWNQSPLTTTYISSQQLTATVPASDVAASGTAEVTVFNPAPGGGSSVASEFTINAAPRNPAPALTTISPTFTSAGSAAFTLTVNGAGFVSASTVYWGSTALSTRFITEGQLTAEVPSAQITSAGITAVTVESPTPGGGTSNNMQFEVDSNGSGSGPTFGNTSQSIAPGGTASYAVTLPASATNVTVDCLNLPSGATCSYSASAGTLSIATSSSTPAGTYVITAAFTETLPGAATALLLLPILLSPRAKDRRRSRHSRVWILACAGILLFVAFSASGCGGGNDGGGSTTPVTHQVVRSESITLSIQ